MQKYRAEKEKYENKLQESPLLGDRYPHCLHVMESVQELFNMPDGHGRLGKGNLAVSYLDTIILRMQNGTDNWYRNHFPVILET